MTFSGHTTATAAPASKNFARGRAGVKPDHFVVHHQAGFTPTTLGMMTSGSRQVSANYVVSSDGSATGVVNEEDTPFTNGNLGWNRRSITFEIENTNKGGPYPANLGKPSAAAHEKVAQIIADASVRHGIPITRDRVLGHRELHTKFGVGYATSCPGELDIDWLVRRASEIRGGTAAPGPIAHNPGPPPATASSSKSTEWVQQRLLIHGYTVTVDNVKGAQTTTAIKSFQRAHNLVQDGVAGDAQTVPALAAGASLRVDGDFGPVSIAWLQQSIGAFIDGVRGPQTNKKLQAKLGQVQDGNFGPVSIKALQRHVGAAVDGIWNRSGQTSTLTQHRLAAGSF